LLEGSLIQASVRGNAVASARLELLEIPPGLGDSHNGNVQVVPFYQRLQGRENLFVGQIPSRAKKDDGILLRSIHRFIYRTDKNSVDLLDDLEQVLRDRLRTRDLQFRHGDRLEKLATGDGEPAGPGTGAFLASAIGGDPGTRVHLAV